MQLEMSDKLQFVALNAPTLFEIECQKYLAT